MATPAVTNTFANTTVADAPEVNANFADLVTFLTDSVVHVDGSKAMAAALAMATFKITGLGDPSGAQDAATKAYVDALTGSTEAIEDYVGAMVGGSSVQTFITVTYDDVGGELDFVVPVKDEDNMVSDSAVFLATQQSIKAYADLMLPLAGGTMSAAIAMGGTAKITGLGAGTAAGDAIRMEQVFGNAGFRQEMAFSKPPGEVVVETGLYRYYNMSGKNREIVHCGASVGVAPTGADLQVDVNVDTVSIYATTQANRPIVAATGFFDEGGAPDDGTWDDGSYITIDIDQIGSTLPGEDLTVVVYFTEDI